MAEAEGEAEVAAATATMGPLSTKRDTSSFETSTWAAMVEAKRARTRTRASGTMVWREGIEGIASAEKLPDFSKEEITVNYPKA